ncbi:hypothetical protein PP749_gp045 [Rhizobium phage RHEph22]|uniref:Uncharacterized protein n=1 Tax=Rhizobium phage RHEph22 TaxID=2836135 RepID=A0AAE7VMY6_9CAUD|nr:hypothetical protein PP749_gp045 [Rhizobium phage RHEph22]QXV74718.1 hypothetical protein [Rhizobium phage RHEph22]QXV74813.1 hypothetical protein [Rhizobium phage RHEph24]
MFSYTAKPREVEAWQYFKDVGTETACIPRWAIQLVLDGIIWSSAGAAQDYIAQEAKKVPLMSGDWIVKDGDNYTHFTNDKFHEWYTPTV